MTHRAPRLPKQRGSDAAKLDRWIVEPPPAPRRPLTVHPLIMEAIVASGWMTAIGVFVAVVYWGLTGLSPWPYVVLSEIAALGFGVVLLALVSPKGRH